MAQTPQTITCPFCGESHLSFHWEWLPGNMIRVPVFNDHLCFPLQMTLIPWALMGQMRDTFLSYMKAAAISNDRG